MEVYLSDLNHLAIAVVAFVYNPIVCSFFFKLITPFVVDAAYAKWVVSLGERMVISPIYPGFDRASHMQPSWI
jgi:hypothetical protein